MNVLGDITITLDSGRLAQIQAAIIKANGQNCSLILGQRRWLINDNLIIPNNITLYLYPNAVLNICDGKVLAVNGPIMANIMPIFSCEGTGKVIFGNQTDVYPQWWGATGNCTTDDSSAIQAAINSLSRGKVILTKMFAVGSASWQGLIIQNKSNISLEAVNEGAGFKVIAPPVQTHPGCSYKVMFLIKDSKEINISRLYINGNNMDNCLIALSNTAYCNISHTHLYDTLTPINNGILSFGGLNNTYVSNIITNCGRGMWIGNCSDYRDIEKCALISGNKCINNKATGIGGTYQDSVISANYLVNNGGSGIALGGWGPNICKYVVITDNNINGSAYHGIQSDVCEYNGAWQYNENIVVKNNLLNNNQYSGLYVVYASKWDVNGNIISNNNQNNKSSNGITVEYANKITIYNNNIYDDQGNHTQFRGILANCYDKIDGIYNISISNNNIYGNFWAGIHITRAFLDASGRNIDISQNKITYNGTYGLIINKGVSNVEVDNNILINNPVDIRLDLDVYGQNNTYYTKEGTGSIEPRPN